MPTDPSRKIYYSRKLINPLELLHAAKRLPDPFKYLDVEPLEVDVPEFNDGPKENQLPGLPRHSNAGGKRRSNLNPRRKTTLIPPGIDLMQGLPTKIRKKELEKDRIIDDLKEKLRTMTEKYNGVSQRFFDEMVC